MIAHGLSLCAVKGPSALAHAMVWGERGDGCRSAIATARAAGAATGPADMQVQNAAPRRDGSCLLSAGCEAGSDHRVVAHKDGTSRG